MSSSCQWKKTKVRIIGGRSVNKEFNSTSSEVIKSLHRRKLIAPIVITTLIVLSYTFFFLPLFLVLGTIGKFISGCIYLALTGTLIKVCIDRVMEIKKGEEDDLSKY